MVLIFNTLTKELNKEWIFDKNEDGSPWLKKNIKEEKKFIEIVKRNEIAVGFDKKK